MRGSLINNIMGSKTDKPEVGMGITFLHYTDRSAGTIVKVCTDRKILVQGDFAMRVDSNGMSESQSYEFKPNPNAKVLAVTRRKDGSWKVTGDGTRVVIGFRQCYHDFSF